MISSGDEYMNYKDMDIKRSYISCGEDGIADALIIPALKCTNHYCRSVGYFSSGVFETIMDGIPTFVRNGGDIKMIARMMRILMQSILAMKKRSALLEMRLAESFWKKLKILMIQDLHCWQN